MKTQLLLLSCLALCMNARSQWNSDLSTNLVIADNGRIDNVIYDGNGYYLTWQEGNGPFTHMVTRLNEDGTSNWNDPVLAHNHDLGSFTVNLQYSGMDNERNFIRVSTYINNDGEFCCINKIDTTGAQLLNGQAGIVFPGMAYGFALGASDNMYVLVNSDLKKLDASGNVLWTSALDPIHTNTGQGQIIESADGTVGVAYFVNGMGNPAYGQYYISRFDEQGNRTTTGSQTIAPAICAFYRPSYFVEMSTGHYYFIGFDTNSSVSFVQHLMGDVPQIGGNGTALDNSANSSFITATMANDSLYAFYQYNWNSFDEGGLKMQAMDLATGTHAYDQGFVLYNEAAGVKPLQQSALNMNGTPACLIVENATQTIQLIAIGAASQNTFNLFTSTTNKGLASVSTYDQINADQKQLVVFMEDYRPGIDQSSAVAQNLLLSSVGMMNMESNHTMMMYPNPAHQSTMLHLDENWIGSTCKIMDGMGRCLESFNIRQSNTMLDLSGLPAGMYYIGMSNGIGYLCRSLIVE